MSQAKLKFATVWLDGCSGCHMSFLDMDERLVGLLDQVELVYSPLVDAKKFPSDVDVTLIEGSVSTLDELYKIRSIRAHTKVLVSLGDCATTGNVPSLRNSFDTHDVFDRAYRENVDVHPVIPGVSFLRGHAVHLDPDDLLVVYTDGATEAPDLKGVQFGEARLEEVIRGAASEGPEAVLAAVRQALHAWTGGVPNRDDLTLMALKAGPSATA